MPRLAAALTACVVVLAAACTNTATTTTDSPSSDVSAPATTGTSGGPPLTGAPAEPDGGSSTTILPTSPLGPWTLADTRGNGFGDSSGRFAPLTDVRTGDNGTYQRIVFTFDGPVPGFEVGYADGPVTVDPTGELADLDAATVLVIRMSPTGTAAPTDDGFVTTYDGPRRLAVDGDGPATEAVLTGDFEALMTWAVGSSERVPFVAGTLSDPSRLVVDLLATS